MGLSSRGWSTFDGGFLVYNGTVTGTVPRGAIKYGLTRRTVEHTPDRREGATEVRPVANFETADLRWFTGT